jgi:hypothetical protein
VNAIVNIAVGRFSEQDRVLLRVDIKLLEYVTPDLFHIVPVLNCIVDGSMLNRVPQFTNSFVLLYSFLTDKIFLFERINHDLLMLGGTNTINHS